MPIARGKRKPRRLAAIAALALCAAATAYAAPLDDLTGAGYAVLDGTVLPGLFTGCVTNRALLFADGSRFICASNWARLGWNLRVLVLGRPGETPSVVLMGGQVAPGALVQLRDRPYRPARRRDAAKPAVLPGRTRGLPLAPGAATLGTAPIAGAGH